MDQKEIPTETEVVQKHSFWYLLKGYLNELFQVKSEVDFISTYDNIRKDIVFRGFNIWILILSIFICSIGLNLNSTAIVIGAMLISPLMGPITGLGFAVGTFDRDMLMSALKNLLTAVIISVLVSFLFFKIAPEGINQSELLSRTKPGVLDLLVATLGGLAGILAAARNVKTNVIPGVAIATALMPPLCTAGFGLATGNMSYFFGAFYLFFINSVFISLSALIVIRYLKFPIASYVNKATRNRGRIVIITFAIAVSIPSIIIYRQALKQSLFEFRARNFVNEVINNDHRQADHLNLYYSDTLREISVWVYGKEISPEQKDSLQEILTSHGLSKSKIYVKNMGDFEAYKKLFERKESEITQKTTTMEILSAQLSENQNELSLYKNNMVLPDRFKIDVRKLNSEAKTLFQNVDTIECVWKSNNFQPADTNIRSMPIFLVNWSAKNRISIGESEKLDKWLHVHNKPQFDTVGVINLFP